MSFWSLLFVVLIQSLWFFGTISRAQKQADMIRRYPNCINIDGVNGLRAAFEWKVANDRQSITGAVHFPRSDLEVGWAALGISNFVGFGMNDADVLFAWKPSATTTTSDDVQYSIKRAQYTGQPATVNNESTSSRFERFWSEVLTSRFVMHFTKQVSCNGQSDCTELLPNEGAILCAINTRETPRDRNTFSFHTWRMKRYVNFLVDDGATIDECGGIFDSALLTPEPSTFPSIPPPGEPGETSSPLPEPQPTVTTTATIPIPSSSSIPSSSTVDSDVPNDPAQSTTHEHSHTVLPIASESDVEATASPHVSLSQQDKNHSSSIFRVMNAWCGLLTLTSITIAFLRVL